MTIDIIQIFLIVILAGLAWWANDRINGVPFLRTILQVVIVVVAVLFLFDSLGLMSHLNTHIHVN